MSQHETKNCPRCNQAFECKPGNITQCHCNTVHLSDELKAYIAGKYTDCLCGDCLKYLQSELNFFKEKYFYSSR